MKTVLNLKNVDFTRQPIFLGEDLNLQRYDKFKYPIFFELFKQQVGQFWFPHEISLERDRQDYYKLTETERFVFDNNLRFQTLGDSMLSRSINALKDYISIPELEICFNVWAFFECIHSYSYSYLLNNVYPDAGKFFDSIMEDKQIVSRANLIRNNYDKILGVDGSERNVKEKIFNSLISINVMEGLVFYVSFACSFYFGVRGVMTGNADIIKKIQQDEAKHFAISQNLIKVLRAEESEGFAELFASKEQTIYDMYEEAAKNEYEWAKYLFQNGTLLGLNAEVLGGYARWLADNRLKSLGYKAIFKEKVNPISSWMDKYLDLSKIQPAPQEKENIQYLMSSRDTSINDEAFSGMKL